MPGNGQAGIPPERWERMEILVVDDDPAIVTVIRTHLEEEGFAVDSACDGHDALEKLQRRGYDLVITDLDMPRLDGMSLQREARQRGMTPRWVVITGNPADPRLRNVESAILYKPFSLATLSTLVRELDASAPKAR